MSKDDDQLQRYFDGELPSAERAAFEAAMTEDDQLRLAALAEMRALVCGALDAEAADIDVWAGVEAGIAGKKIAKTAEKRAAVRGWRGRRFLGTSAGLLMAAAAAFLFMVKPWHADHPTDGCDIENLEVAGAVATVLQVHDTPHGGDGPTTIIWTTEED